MAARERVEQRRFAGVGIAGEGHGRHPRPRAAAAVQRPTTLHGGELRAHLADARGKHSLIEFQLRFAAAPLRGTADLAPASTTASATDAALPVQVGPTPHEARLGMGELRELHLQMALVGAGPIREDVQDQFRARHHPALEASLEVALLRRRQGFFVVEDHDVGACSGDFRREFFHFANTQEPARMRLVATSGHDPGAHQGRRTHEFEKLRPMRIALVLVTAEGVETHGHQGGEISGRRSFKQHGRSLRLGRRTR